MLPGTEAKYSELEEGETETPSYFLPSGAKVFYRTPACVNAKIMLA